MKYLIQLTRGVTQSRSKLDFLEIKKSTTPVTTLEVKVCGKKIN